MAYFGGPLNVPQKDAVIRLNKRLIEASEGRFVEPDNLLNAGSLDWVLEIITRKLFDHDPYPSLAHKAAILAWTVIDGHVFYDGNKRTGLALSMSFLNANNCSLNATAQEIIQVALWIATRTKVDFNLTQLIEWFREHIEFNDDDIAPL